MILSNSGASPLDAGTSFPIMRSTMSWEDHYFSMEEECTDGYAKWLDEKGELN
jgi:hypothetical protein